MYLAGAPQQLSRSLQLFAVGTPLGEIRSIFAELNNGPTVFIQNFLKSENKQPSCLHSLGPIPGSAGLVLTCRLLLAGPTGCCPHGWVRREPPNPARGMPNPGAPALKPAGRFHQLSHPSSQVIMTNGTGGCRPQNHPKQAGQPSWQGARKEKCPQRGPGDVGKAPPAPGTAGQAISTWEVETTGATGRVFLQQ